MKRAVKYRALPSGAPPRQRRSSGTFSGGASCWPAAPLNGF